jgi:hypothetical protein
MDIGKNRMHTPCFAEHGAKRQRETETEKPDTYLIAMRQISKDGRQISPYWTDNVHQ